MASSGRYQTVLSLLRDIGLITLSITLLPLSLFITILAKFLTTFGVNKPVRSAAAIHNGRQVNVLVTGVSMSKGLFLARTMYLGGCRVIGADFEKNRIPAAGRWSKACSGFHALIAPISDDKKRQFFKQMLSIITSEHVDIWISCSGVATAIEDAQLMQLLERETKCRCFQFNEQATFSLDDKYRFMKTTADLGLAVPQWFSLTSKRSTEEAFSQATTQKNKDSAIQYILKNVAMDDKTRGSLPLLHSNDSRKMKEILESIDVVNSEWIMQQFIPGKEEYCTQALVIDGQVKAFCSCPSESVLMHYEQLQTGSALDEAMLDFTQTYATGLYKKYGNFTGHLSFDFLALQNQTRQGITKTLLPIECNPRCHTAVVRFRGRERELAAAYLSILPGMNTSQMVSPDDSKQSVVYYWIAHDLVELYIMPIISMFLGKTSLLDMLGQHLDFWRLVVCGKDPTFEWWDPTPWFVLNHIYWPARFADIAIRGVQWSQMNVSTGKVFEK